MTVHVRRLAASDDADLYLRLDNGALADAGISHDTPVTVEFPGACTVDGIVKTSGGNPWLAPGRAPGRAAARPIAGTGWRLTAAWTSSDSARSPTARSDSSPAANNSELHWLAP